MRGCATMLVLAVVGVFLFAHSGAPEAVGGWVDHFNAALHALGGR